MLTIISIILKSHYLSIVSSSMFRRSPHITSQSRGSILEPCRAPKVILSSFPYTYSSYSTCSSPFHSIYLSVYSNICLSIRFVSQLCVCVCVFAGTFTYSHTDIKIAYKTNKNYLQNLNNPRNKDNTVTNGIYKIECQDYNRYYIGPVSYTHLDVYKRQY